MSHDGTYKNSGQTTNLCAIRKCNECNASEGILIRDWVELPTESYYHLYLGEIQAFDGERIRGLEKENE